MSQTTTIDHASQADVATLAGLPSESQASLLDIAGILEEIEREITGPDAAGHPGGAEPRLPRLPRLTADDDWEPSEEDWRDMYNWCEWIDMKEMESRCTDEDIRILHGCVG